MRQRETLSPQSETLLRVFQKQAASRPLRDLLSRVFLARPLMSLEFFCRCLKGGRMRKADNNNDAGKDQGLARHTIDLATMFSSDLHVGGTSVHQNLSGYRFRVRYEVDGKIRDQTCYSPLYWRAMVLFALRDERRITIHEMDETGRYRQLFPKTLCRRLAWHAKPGGNFPPVARLFDPDGCAVLYLTRSRFHGHGVDVLHNLTEGPPVFQALWISDLIGLQKRAGIDLVRDQAFASTMPIGAYLEAAVLTGRLVDDAEIPWLPLTGKVPRVPAPEPSSNVRKVFNLRCIEYPALERLRYRTIHEDYGFGQDPDVRGPESKQETDGFGAS